MNWSRLLRMLFHLSRKTYEGVIACLRQYKTTSVGIILILIGVAEMTGYMKLYGDPIAPIIAGIGLVFARDAKARI